MMYDGSTIILTFIVVVVVDCTVLYSLFHCEVVNGVCRVFVLIDNSVHQHTRGSDAASAENLNPEEAMLDVCLLSTTNSIMQQCSLPIYTVCRYYLYALLFVLCCLFTAVCHAAVLADS